MNIIFAGTPDFAATHLAALLESEHQVIAVYTQPDRPAGRGKKLTPSAVKQCAIEYGIPVLQPVSLKDAEAQAELMALGADIMVVVAYGLLLPKAVLEAPAYGCLNVHGSLLPYWRGAAPIQRAVEAGDAVTGVTIMQMDEGLDTGDMLLKVECDITDEDSSSDIYQRLAGLGPPALLSVLSHVEANALKPEPQDNTQASYASKIIKSEAHIDWSEPAELIARKVRAFNPFPICYTGLNNERFKIHAVELYLGHCPPGPSGVVVEASSESCVVACGEGAVRLLRVQLPGKKVMTIESFMNGFAQQLSKGTHFLSLTAPAVVPESS